MVIKHDTVKAPGQTLAAVADWNANHTGDLNHGTELTNVTSDQHHAQSHNAASHSDITVTGANIDASFAHVSADGSSHADVAANTLKETNVTTNLSLGVITATTMIVASSDGTDATLIEADTDDAGLLGADKWDEIVANTAAKHARQHAITTAADHTSTATPAQMLKADANGLPIDATNTDAQVSGAVTASHAIQHAIDSAADHTSTITENNLMDADGNGLPDDSGLTVANTSDAITKKHTQNTDVSLKSNATTGVMQVTGPAAGTTRVKTIRNANDTIVELGGGGTFTAAVEAADHGAAATDQVINVCYGEGAPPAANTTTIGSLFVQYTA